MTFKNPTHVLEENLEDFECSKNMATEKESLRQSGVHTVGDDIDGLRF